MNRLRAIGISQLSAFAVILLMLVNCSPEAPHVVHDSPAPLVLISIDTLRSDRLGCYGYEGNETPNIDRLAKRSVLFERAYTVCPLTLPAHSSLMTGTLPTEHGVRDNRGFELDRRLPTLAESLSEQGYRTGGFVSSMVLRESTGIARGFDHWDDEMSVGTGQTFAQRRGDETIQRALSWLDERADSRPPFLFVHLYDPHSPYDAPLPWGESIDDAYDAEIAWTDELVGRLLEGLTSSGFDETAWIVLVSDHGEGLGDHVEKEHGLFLYREAIQIPLLIRPPGGVAASRREEPVSLADLMPTLLDRLGLPSTADRAWLSDQYSPSGVYSETMFPKFQYGFSPLKSAIRGDLQYIQAPREELYDLRLDPLSTDNLLTRQSVPPSLLDLIAQVGEGLEVEAPINDDEAEALASLGYVGGAESVRGATLVDPKDRVHDVEELFTLAAQVGKSPTDDVEIRLVRLMTNLNLRNESLAITVATNLLQNGEINGAAEVMKPFKVGPSPKAQQLLGQIALERGDYSSARNHFQSILATSPTASMANLGLGMVELSVGNLAAAGRAFDKALELDDRLAEAWNGRAIIEAQAGRWDPAIRAWKRSVELDPTLADAWYNLALALAQRGELELAAEARQQFEQLQ